MAEHHLKTDPAVFAKMLCEAKGFEIRFNDRDFQEGDELVLEETRYTGEQTKQGAPLRYTGEKIRRTVTYVMRGPIYGLQEGWVIMSLKPSI